MKRQALFIQIIFVMAFSVAWALRSPETERNLHHLVTGMPSPTPVRIPRTEPLQIAPLFDREEIPDVVKDEEIAYVLHRLRPKFSPKELRPNIVEHALRTWGIDAEFRDPEVLSGQDMTQFLTDHGTFLKSWGGTVDPLLQPTPTGIAIRWGRTRSGSVHHDHWLASLSEAGITLDHPVYGPGRPNATIEDVLREALRDFRLDEREAEWTAMAFGLWLPPTHEWIGDAGRHYSFDLIAQRLIRGHGEKGVCVGTHRVYSLTLLLRLDDQFDEVLSDAIRQQVEEHLTWVRDAIAASQFEDGHWSGNWPDGAAAIEHPRNDKLSTLIIATGHHLEWQAIAPGHLRLSDAQNRKAVEWLLKTMRSQSDDEVMKSYTFYSHVGNAFALWRKTRPMPFWKKWLETHPRFEQSPADSAFTEDLRQPTRKAKKTPTP